MLTMIKACDLHFTDLIYKTNHLLRVHAHSHTRSHIQTISRTWKSRWEWKSLVFELRVVSFSIDERNYLHWLNLICWQSHFRCRYVSFWVQICSKNVTVLKTSNEGYRMISTFVLVFGSSLWVIFVSAPHKHLITIDSKFEDSCNI